MRESFEIKCPACNHSLIIDNEINKLFLFPRLKFEYTPKIFKCTNCGMRMLHPILTQEQYEAIYRDEYFTTEEDNFYIKSKNDRLRVYENKVQRILSYTKDAKSLVDVGAGDGDFLNICKNYFEIWGIELSDFGITQAKKNYNIDLKKGGANDIKDFQKSFDVIHMHHVFEHLIAPNVYLQILKKCMHPGSIFIFEVPHQFESIQEKISRIFGMSKMFSGLFAIHHPYFYTPKSLTMMLNNNGYDVLNITTCPPERKIVLYDSYLKKYLRNFLFYFQKVTKRGPVIEIICKVKEESI